MPSTAYTDITTGARTVGARTDNVGSAVDDLSAEEDRFAAVSYGEGYLEPLTAFEAVKGSVATYDVLIGSGAAKTDYYVVLGDDSGQGQYVVRLEAATETVVISASPGSDARIDEIYLVVQDGAYGPSSNALPRFAVREGDVAASPSAPGPDSNWDAYALLVTIDVDNTDTDIVDTVFTDERVGATATFPSMALLGGGLEMGAGDITTTGDVDGLDLNTHDHDGVAGGAQIDANDVTDMKTAVDAVNIDADTLDGLHAAGLTLIAHTGAGGAAHADVIAGGADGFMTGADKTKLDSMEDNATADETPAQHLAKIITVDGAGTGLDADLLDSHQLVNLPAQIIHLEVNVQQGDVLFGATNVDHHSWTFTKPSGWTQYDMIVMAYPWFKKGGAGSHAETFVTATGSGSASSSSRDSEISADSRSCTVPVTVVVTSQSVNNTIKMTSKKLNGGTGITADGTTFVIFAIRTA